MYASRMRYMGRLGGMGAMGAATGPAIPLPQLGTPGPLDPQTKGALLALAPNVPDAQAQDLLDFVDATPLGKNQRMMRIGGGALAGLVLGVVACKLLSKKR